MEIQAEIWTEFVSGMKMEEAERKTQKKGLSHFQCLYQFAMVLGEGTEAHQIGTGAGRRQDLCVPEAELRGILVAIDVNIGLIERTGQ